MIRALLPIICPATPISTFASRRCGRSARMVRARDGNMRCVNGRCRLAGLPGASTSSIRISECPGRTAQDVMLPGIGRSGGASQGRLVLGLEVSRLARNSVDWQQLLQLCAYTDTLILDEEGIYDPSAFNDRLLLGLKGTMSEPSCICCGAVCVVGSSTRRGVAN